MLRYFFILLLSSFVISTSIVGADDSCDVCSSIANSTIEAQKDSDTTERFGNCSLFCESCHELWIALLIPRSAFKLYTRFIQLVPYTDVQFFTYIGLLERPPIS